jgi:ParB-like nuclease domain
VARPSRADNTYNTVFIEYCQHNGVVWLPAVWVETRDVPVGELIPFPGNARRGDVAAIRASVRRHGQYRSLIVRDTGTALVVLAGNHTRAALAAEGETAARCEIITCTDEEARRINLADNKISDIAVYDEDDLAELLSYLDGDYDGTGWSEPEVDRLVHSADWVPDPDGGLSGEVDAAMITCPSCGTTFPELP